MKIAIIGAGSMFTRHFTVDILSIDGLDEGEFALVDIDPTRLELAHKLVEMVVARRANGGPSGHLRTDARSWLVLIL